MQSSQGNVPPPVPPRRPPRALSPSQARTTTASSSNSSNSSSTSMLRSRALARVNRIAAATGDYVAPRLESAAVSASTKLAHWRDRDREQQQAQASNYSTTAGADAGGYAYQVRQPKRAAAATTASSSSRAVNPGTSDRYNEQSVLPPYTRSMTTSSTAPSEAASSTSASTAGSSSRKWTASGLGSYLNLSSYSAFGGGASATADSDSMAATGGTKGKGKATAVGTDDIDEDKVLCFPGWATLEPSPHHDASEPALVLSIHAHGYAYRQRPLSQASRSQRIFYALAKSFAALPKIPPATAAAAASAAGSTPATAAAIEAEEEVRDLEDKVQGLGVREEEAAGDKEGEGEEAIEKLLAVGGRAGDRLAEAELEHEAVAVTRGDLDRTRQTYGEPDEMTLEERAQSPTARDFAAAATATTSKSSSSSPRSTTTRSQTSSAVSTSSTRSAAPSPEESPILSTPAKLSRRPGFRIEIPSSTAAALKRAGNSTSQPGSPGGSGTASPVRSPGLKSVAFNLVKRGGDKNKAGSSSATSSRASSRATSPVRNNGRTREAPTRSSTASTITSTAASTGAAALPPETWPAPFTLPSDPAALPRLHTNLHTRLLPFFGAKLANRKVRLSVLPALGEGQLYDGVLATKVVRTHATSGGGFRTRLEVKGPELKKWLELVGARGSGQGDRNGNGARTGVEALRVRVVAELLEPEAVLPSVVDTAPSFGAGASGASLGATAAADKYATATAVDEIELDVAIQGDGGEGGGVRIVSDVDDTIKWTEVTKGTKTIFRNVFVRELPEIRVPGMATWYRQLQAHGAQFHYVSNSPVELWPVLRTFLKLSGFPNGSCTLKEYGGASSAIAKLWEEPGQRKKANVENILKEFPAARFILVGDSGEQDLELYVALARQYPSNILAIYIRDVTTPFDPIAADPARRHSRERESARAAAAAAESAQDGHPRRAGTDQPAPSHESSKRLSREASLPPEITWKHRNSIHDLAGLIDDDALRFAAPEAFSPTTSQRPSFEVERTLSDMPDLPGQWDGPHERPVPPRRSSDTVLVKHVSREPPSSSDARAVPDTPTSPYTSSPAPLDSPSLMSEPDSDPLSPNNPIRPAPAGTAQDAAVEAFYRRVAAAEKGLPKGIILRLFRHGNECAEEALELVKTAGKRPFGA